MKYEITIGQHGKFLFRIEPESFQSANELVKAFAILAEKFPSDEGYYMHLRINWLESVSVDTAEFTAAVKAGKGKGYLQSLKHKRRRASWMTHILYRGIEKGLI